MGKPKLVPGMGLSDSKYFESSKGYTYDDNEDFERLKDGYSRVAHQDAPKPVAFTQSKKQLRGGGFELGEKKYIYEKVDTEPQQVSAPMMPEAAPTPVAQPVPKPDEKVEYSAPVQQAQNLVNEYKSNIMNNSGLSSQIYGTPAQATFNDPQKEAANSFLNFKKIQFGEGLNLQ
jgi:hypothetical protein